MDNATNKSSKFTTKNWVEIKDDSRGTCNTNSQIKLKTKKLKLRLCVYSDTSILVKGTIKTVPKMAGAAAAAAGNNSNKKVIFKNCAPFIDCISKKK